MTTDAAHSSAGALEARRRGRGRLLAALAVFGPGLLAGLSDDDPAGITTYSVLGSDHGYQLLWVLLFSTLALVLFHDLASRMGVVTGQGLIGLVRQRFGMRWGSAALLTLLVANLGTATAEMAGIAAGSELLGVSRYVSVPLAATAVTVLVLAGSFHRVEHLLLILASVFLAYVAAGLLAHPDWSAAAHGLLVPTLDPSRSEMALVAATIGTTLAPWGLSFIQSYAVDKRLTTHDLRYERVDVVTGSVLTGVIGFFVVVACAETLHVAGRQVDSAADAATALEPVAGHFAGTLFAVGLLGAALLAAAVLPLSTAYSVCDLTGTQAGLDSRFSDAKVFYVTAALVTGLATVFVLAPHVPLVPVLVWTQALNAVLLVPLLVAMHLLSRDRDLMGHHVSGRFASVAQVLVTAAVGVSVLLLVL